MSSTSTTPGLYGSKGGDPTPPADPPPVTPSPVDPALDGDDVLHAGSGNETLYGGKGQDTAVFDGDLSDYLIDFDPGTWQVVITDRTGGHTHHLASIEQLQFGDTTIALDGLNGLMREAGDDAAEWQRVDGYPLPQQQPEGPGEDIIVFIGVTTPGDIGFIDDVAFGYVTTTAFAGPAPADAAAFADASGSGVELVGLALDHAFTHSATILA
ncbi:hypothetical protein [Aquabacterium humicola]|uniref:hypothetical protein n=1 Tax=Aquabacterium humicola TaxID=3237377 RepID=UPI002543A7C8|nr:hypothetical protein [Rubrivivax pictus]